MKYILTVVFLLTLCRGFSQDFSITDYRGQRGFFVTPATALKIADSILTLRDFRAVYAYEEARADSLEKKLTLCTKVDKLQEQRIGQLKTVIAKDSELFEMNEAEIITGKENFKIQEKKIKRLRVKMIFLEATIGGLAYLVYRGTQ